VTENTHKIASRALDDHSQRSFIELSLSQLWTCGPFYPIRNQQAETNSIVAYERQGRKPKTKINFCLCFPGAVWSRPTGRTICLLC